MLLVIVLDYAMQDMIVQWPAAEALDLDRGTGGLFYHPSADLVRMVPEPAMGVVLGFQYYDSQSNGNGDHMRNQPIWAGFVFSVIQSPGLTSTTLYFNDTE